MRNGIATSNRECINNNQTFVENPERYADNPNIQQEPEAQKLP